MFGIFVHWRVKSSDETIVVTVRLTSQTLQIWSVIRQVYSIVT